MQNRWFLGLLILFVLTLSGCGQNDPSSASGGGELIESKVVFLTKSKDADHFNYTRYLVSPDGTGLTNLETYFNTVQDEDWTLQFSPQGTHAVFNDYTETADVYIGSLKDFSVLNMTKDLEMPSVIPSTGAWSPDGNQIVWMTADSQDSSGYATFTIYVGSLEGQAIKAVAEQVVLNGEPRWSPSGDKIAYFAYPDKSRSSFPHLFIINLEDGSLTDTSAYWDTMEYWELPEDRRCSNEFYWSPDGEKVVLDNCFGAEIFLYDDTQKTFTQLFAEVGFLPVPVRYYNSVVWSSNSRSVAIVAYGGGENQDDSASQILLRDDNSYPVIPGPDSLGIHARNVKWSPDGRRFAFESNFTGNYEVYVGNIDNIELLNVSTNLGDDFIPMWSPNGQQLLFVSNREGNGCLYIADMNSNEVKRASSTTFDCEVQDVSWSPDGTMIAFSSEVSGDSEVYVLNVGSGEVKNITQSAGTTDVRPEWVPSSRS